MKHRGVGGLISMIGLVIVFGIASAAFLQINSAQQSFIASSVNVNKIILDKNNQKLNFTIINNGLNQNYTVGVNNTSSQTISLDSYLLVDSTGIRTAKYLDGKNTTAGKSFQFNITKSQLGDKHVIFVTDLGKKCLVPIGVSFRVC